MNRRFLCLSLIGTVISSCSVIPSNGALGSFDYTKKTEGQALVIPENLSQPKQNNKFVIKPVTTPGPVGKIMDVRSPSLVLPIATSSRLELNSPDAIIWFDQVFDDKNLFSFIYESVESQLRSENVELIPLDEQAKIYQSTWYNKEEEEGLWFFSEVSEIENVKFNYFFEVKPHGRSVGLRVEVAGFMKTDKTGGTNEMNPIDKQRAEMNMLNNIVAQVDYKYRIHQHENRLLRSNQKLVTIGENSQGEASYIVEMELDQLWSNMPSFFENHGFKVTDLNEPKKTYYVDFEQPDISIWSTIWGDEVSVIEIQDAKYQFVLKTYGEERLSTIVTIYKESGEALPLEALEKVFPVMEKGLSFRNVF